MLFLFNTNRNFEMFLHNPFWTIIGFLSVFGWQSQATTDWLAWQHRTDSSQFWGLGIRGHGVTADVVSGEGRLLAVSSCGGEGSLF